MSAMPHRVRRQSWLGKTMSEEQAFALNRRLRENLVSVLLPALGTAFDEVVAGDAVVHVPKLELRVRIQDVEAVTSLLPNLLIQAAKEQLHRRATAPHAVARSSVVAVEPAPAVKAQETVSQYLETGVAPWWALQLRREETVALLRDALSSQLTAVLRRWRGEVVPSALRVQRFVRLLQLTGNGEWPAIAADVGIGLASPAREALARTIVLIAEAGEARGRPFQAVLVAAAVMAAAQAPYDADIVELARDSAVQTSLEQRSVTANIRAALREFFRTLGTLPAAASRANMPSTPSAVTRPSISREREVNGTSPLNATPSGLHEPSPARPPEEREAAQFALPVAHAGLILLHPFLPALLENAGVHRGEPRAAALLYLIATGRDASYEFELGFIKVLLGGRPDSPLMVDAAELRDRDREEADALLRAVLQHWTALKKTSVEGLRTGFLQRGGLLSQDEDGWHLQIPREPFDVLLDHLPWEISTAALPWLSQPIFTTW